jgi:predicted dienelactone hydrolase
VLATLGVLGLGTLVGALWLEHRTDVTLPTPTGPFAVGRTLYDWTDPATLDPLAPIAGTKRELLVWIWYPTPAISSSVVASPYLPASSRTAVERARGPLLGGLLTRDLAKVHAHSLPHPPLSPHERSYPVVIMRAGASLEVWNYTTLAQDLASHGYIVVGVDAPYRTGVVAFPDGRVMRRTPANNPELALGSPDSARRINTLLAAWTGDMSFVLDRLQQLNARDSSGTFTGRLDLTRVGVVGHSFGGAQAAQFCHDDPRCTAGIDVDGALLGSVVREGIPHPFMFLLSDHGDFSSDDETRRIRADIQSVYDRLPPDGRLLIAIRGANHFTFSDDGALLKSHLFRGALRLFGQLGLDGRRQLAVTAYCVHTFFDTYLAGPAPSRLTLPSPRYPEILVLE